MFRMLLQKYIGESLLLLAACGIMLFIFPWVRIWTVSQFELSGFEPLLQQIRILEKFSPVPLEQFLTYPGVIGLTFDEPILILCTLVWCIARGSDVVSGEIGRGTMEMLLAQPVSRVKTVLAHGLVTISGLALLAALTFAGMYVGIETNSVWITRPGVAIQVPGLPFQIENPWAPPVRTLEALSDHASIQLYVTATLNLFSLGFFVFALSVFFSSFDRFRWRTIGLTIGFYICQLLLFVLAKSTPKLGFLKNFSFLAAYQPDWMIQESVKSPERIWHFWIPETASFGALGYIVFLLAAGLVLYGVGIAIFCRRDIPAPL